MKKKLVSVLLAVSLTAALLAGCATSGNNSEEPAEETQEETQEEIEEPAEEAAEEETEAEGEETEEAAEEGEKEDTGASAKPEGEINVESATAEQVTAFMGDDDEKTVLVDARPQEAFSGWALEGAKNGGHLKNAVLFSARWLDCEYSAEAPRSAYLERAMKDQNITSDSEVIVYDYTGEQAKYVAGYLQEQGVKNVTVFQANDLIDTGKDLESYKNYDMFIPADIVKSISDVKTGKEKELSDEAKAVIGNNLDKVVLVDVSWGNPKGSTYFAVGHVPGSVHINTDSYERPRVYVPEKRSDYAKEWRLIPLEEFRDTVCPQYGITKDSIVILSGAGSSDPQGRLGLMLRSVGVKVYSMSGMLTAWKYNGYELDTDESTLVVPDSVDSFGSNKIANPNEILWMDDIKAIYEGKAEGQIVDNRGETEYNGEYSGYSYHDLAGRVDGAILCSQGSEEEGEFFQNVDNTPRTNAEIESYLESCGLDISKVMAFYCGDSWGAAKISYWCQSVDVENVKEWGEGWIPWSNLGNEFIDHNGNKVHYDKYLDTVVDEKGNDVRDGVNILDDPKEEGQ